MKGKSLLFSLGLFCFIYWLADFVNIIFFLGKPAYLLWYSSAGLFFTSIALLLRSPTLISIMFCALFVPEAIWTIDFLGKVLFNTHIFGVTNYLFTFGTKDFVMSLYHLVIPPVLLIGVTKIRKVPSYSWVGALSYAVIIAALTFALVGPNEPVNCVHNLARCRGVFSFVFSALPYPYHIVIVITAIVLVVFIPTNYTLMHLKRNSPRR